MKQFRTFEHVPNMQECMKKQIVVNCKQMDEPFKVESLEGNYAYGKPGDYLMQGVNNELYICDKEIFEKSYDVLEVKDLLNA